MAVIGAGGIGFDVSEFLVTDESPTLDLSAWLAGWGVSDPARDPGGLAPGGPRPARPLRQVTLLQRRSERPGRRLGRTTGWIHRASLQMKGVRMLGGASYERIAPEGLWVRLGAGEPELIPADTIVLCAGQDSERRLAEALALSGRNFHLIGGRRWRPSSTPSGPSTKVPASPLAFETPFPRDRTMPRKSPDLTGTGPNPAAFVRDTLEQSPDG